MDSKPNTVLGTGEGENAGEAAAGTEVGVATGSSQFSKSTSGAALATTGAAATGAILCGATGEASGARLTGAAAVGLGDGSESSPSS